MFKDWTIDHIGYAVKNMEKAVKIFQNLGFVFEAPVNDMDRNLEICFGKKEGYCIELLTALSDGSTSVDTWLKKVGPTPYHFCYSTGNFSEDIKKIQEEGYRLIVPPAKAPAFNGRNVAFFYHMEIGLIELLEANENGGLYDTGNSTAIVSAVEKIP